MMLGLFPLWLFCDDELSGVGSAAGTGWLQESHAEQAQRRPPPQIRQGKVPGDELAGL
jgi:hypothetical protein